MRPFWKSRARRHCARKISKAYAAATRVARERVRLERIGQTPSLADGMIAATTAANNLILVTRNTKDFERFDGLHVENWFEA